MTDVIDDLEHALGRAVQCLTFILENLLHRIQLNQHRPLNRRTLVRWISAFMPAPKDPRVRLQPKLRDGPNNAPLHRWGSCGSLGSAYSAASLQNLVEEDLGDNLVRFRIDNNDDDYDYSAVAFEETHFAPIENLSNRFTSTPNFDQSESSSAMFSDQQGGKLAEMEVELAALRKQIAMLVMAQESSMVTDKTEEVEFLEESQTLSASPAAALPLPGSPALCSTLNDSGCESSESIPVGQKVAQSIPVAPETNAPVVIPAPPPPPPLPLFLETNRESVAELIKKRKASGFSQQEPKGVPDMADVLKGLGSVKLKAVERSPGGTPMCRRKLDHTPTDPASIIARALKRKFASHRGLSPESDQENDMSSFLSDSSSPFGQRMLKKTQRRLSLFNDSDDWTPVPSPMKTINV
ncbi:hypothetical protein EGW08_009052 [Elysia chlorotica]|uniref:Uncharacterized protein n=1 Tax=Elysia chlorotica TaxID=188477 RepID=A0A3S0ZNJ6_ELYCH|nr:hypothetical protein EGW08_009052 [Elysia chlorotica]